jgi:hypothetical protein
MTSIVEAMTALVDALAGAGIRAVVDERDINPPCALVNPPDVAYRFGKGGWSATWRVWAIVPDSGRNVSMANLDTLMGEIQLALGGMVTTATPINVSGVDGAGPLPAYEMVLTTTLQK